MENIRRIKLILQKQKVGDWDFHFTDENGNKLATLLRNANGKGYLLIMHIDIQGYETIQIGSLMRGSSVVEKLLKKNGYNITNSRFSH